MRGPAAASIATPPPKEVQAKQARILAGLGIEAQNPMFKGSKDKYVRYDVGVAVLFDGLPTTQLTPDGVLVNIEYSPLHPRGYLRGEGYLFEDGTLARMFSVQGEIVDDGMDEPYFLALQAIATGKVSPKDLERIRHEEPFSTMQTGAGPMPDDKWNKRALRAAVEKIQEQQARAAQLKSDQRP